MNPERLAQLILASIDFAILTTDLDGVIKSWNKAAERLLGWSAIEAIGWDACMIFTPQDVAAGLSQREMEKARASGRAADERQHVRQDGTRFWGVSIMMMMLDDVAGEHVGYVKMVCIEHFQGGKRLKAKKWTSSLPC